MRKRITMPAVVVAMFAAVSAWALDGQNGYQGTLVLTASGIQSDSGYASAFAGEAWADLGALTLFAPIGPGQRDGLAADGAGNLYVIVQAADAGSTDGPQYTGLVRYDGTDATTLLQDQMSSPYYATRTGSELQAVVVSPSSSGLLTAGDPVVLRQVNEMGGGVLQASFELVGVNSGTGAETLLYRFGNVSYEVGRIAIDGTGGSTDGTIYVGPERGGSGAIARLTFQNGAYVRDTVPGSFQAGSGLLVGPDGDLYTFSIDANWGGLVSPYPDQDVYRVDPATGSASVWGAVDGKSFIFDWAFDSDGALWFGLRTSGRKARHYITRGVAGGVTSVADRISDSSKDPWCIAPGGSGVVYVLESPFASDGAIYSLTPGSGGGGGGGGKGGGKGK